VNAEPHHNEIHFEIHWTSLPISMVLYHKDEVLLLRWNEAYFYSFFSNHQVNTLKEGLERVEDVVQDGVDVNSPELRKENPGEEKNFINCNERPPNHR
jgi:hypothetical protein